MIRIVNVIAVIMVFLAGFALYRMKFDTQKLQDRVDHLNQQMADDQAEIKVLDAEWAYLARPERLETLAARYLPMKPAGPGQVLLTVASIAPRTGANGKPVMVADYEPPDPVQKSMHAPKVFDVRSDEPARASPPVQERKVANTVKRRPFNPLTDKIRLISTDGARP